MMAQCGKAFAIRMMWRLLHVSPSGYYASQRRSLSHLARKNAQLLQEIRRIHAESEGGSMGVLNSGRNYKGRGMAVANIVWLDL